MTQGRKKWRVRLAFESNRYAQEQLQKAYEQISPIEARSTAQPSATQPAVARQATIKRGGR
jgi:hypothetical protein